MTREDGVILTDAELPGAWKDADYESGRNQLLTLRLTKGKIGGGLVAAAGGTLSVHAGSIDVAAWLVFVGFLLALTCEILSWTTKSEQIWYEGRAVAESVKTLAWRYTVCADPFVPEMDEKESMELLRKRILSVTREVSDKIAFDSSGAVVSDKMAAIRRSSFTNRRKAYINGRTLNQKEWYARKARSNRRQASIWRSVLIVVELLAIILAFGRIAGGWAIDFAGLLAAAIAAGTAWVAVKQFSSLASAYSLAANELGIQGSRLNMVGEDDWPMVAADAEEAISREHTTWLASRTGRLPNWTME